MIGTYFDVVKEEEEVTAASTRCPATTFAVLDGLGVQDDPELGAPEEGLPPEDEPLLDPPDDGPFPEEPLEGPDPDPPTETPSKMRMRSAGAISGGLPANCCWRTWAKSCVDSHSFVCDKN